MFRNPYLGAKRQEISSYNIFLIVFTKIKAVCRNAGGVIGLINGAGIRSNRYDFSIFYLAFSDFFLGNPG